MVMGVEALKVKCSAEELAEIQRLASDWTDLKLMALIADSFAPFVSKGLNDDTPADLAYEFDQTVSSDLSLAIALVNLDEVLSLKKVAPRESLMMVSAFDSVLGLNLLNLTREDLRIRPKAATITEEEITDALAIRKAARAEKDFATSDAIRDELASKGVEVMDGDPLGWEWKL
jgi:cysteinyl-tRNA synthetase